MNEVRLSASYLARQEIRRRPWQFLLSCVAVASGVTVVVGCLLALGKERREASALLADQERQLDERFAHYSQTLAEAMTKAGFNVIVLPAGQELDDWYREDFAAKSFPADLRPRLERPPLATIEHLLPRLVGRFVWPERKWTVIVYGTAPEPIQPSALGTRWLDRSVPPGHVDIGCELAQAFRLQAGQELAVGGTAYRVRRCLPATGTKEDIGLLFALQDAQRILGRPGQVNEILALEKPVAWGDIEQVRSELARRLPQAQAVEIRNRVVASVWARRMTEKEARNLLDRERRRQADLQRGHRRLAVAASLSALAVSALWLAVMTTLNLSRRRREIGLLAALGLSPGGVRNVFLIRVLLAAVCGIAIGASPWLFRQGFGNGQPLAWLLAAVAAALPAILTAALITHHQIARRDPADVLKNES
jgi:hypothetical protein